MLGGCLNFDTWHKNPQYKLVTSAEDNIVFVSIRHMDGRLIKPKPNFNYASFGIFVMKLDRRTILKAVFFKATD